MARWEKAIPIVSISCSGMDESQPVESLAADGKRWVLANVTNFENCPMQLEPFSKYYSITFEIFPSVR